MENHSEEKKIAKLIGAKILGILSDEDKKALNEWINQCPENLLLYKRLKSKKLHKEWRQNHSMLELENKWVKIQAHLEKEKRKIRVLKLMKYAASLLVPLLIIGGIVYYTQEQSHLNNFSQEVLVDIHPGGNKAILILDDGKSVELDNPETLTLFEKDGTTIKKVDGKLDYLNVSKKGSEASLYNTIRIPRGGEYKLVLSDGTKVQLNSMSEIKYPVTFSGQQREVELIGEAFFEVTTNGKPFIVKTKEMNIRVLGTKFNVNAYPTSENVITTLVEGKVEIELGNQRLEKRLLSPNEQAVLDINNKSIDVAKVNAALFTAWKDGKFIFHDMSLGEIMEVLTRWYSCDVAYLNPSVEKLRFSGSINRYGDISQILEIIKLTRKVNVEINDTKIIFSGI